MSRTRARRVGVAVYSRIPNGVHYSRSVNCRLRLFSGLHVAEFVASTFARFDPHPTLGKRGEDSLIFLSRRTYARYTDNSILGRQRPSKTPSTGAESKFHRRIFFIPRRPVRGRTQQARRQGGGQGLEQHHAHARPCCFIWMASLLLGSDCRIIVHEEGVDAGAGADHSWSTECCCSTFGSCCSRKLQALES